MCGFAGEIRFDGRPVSPDRIATMTRQMTARGPDASGVVVRGAMGMGHRRLQIIDLSERARQPMEDPELGLTLVFNGCIYNYRKLRSELERAGYRFFSHSDSEVILKAYHAWGERCVERFNGMFAFVIHERDGGRVFMARDRLGIKPLYFVKTPSYLRFASSVPALLKASRRKVEIDPVALHHYMTFHSVVPAPRTILREIRKLPPAMTRMFEPHAGTFTERCYWTPRFDRDAEYLARTEGQVVDDVLEGLRQAVGRRMEADVPVGVLLSGGVDSSIVTGLLAELGVEDLKTFSVGFADTPEESGNEFKYSDVVANRFRTDHHKIHVDTHEMLDHLPECIAAMSEPMVSHDAIGFYFLSKYVSEHVKVVQSGQGADELFGGYHWYQALRGSESPVEDYARAFFDRDHAEYGEAVAGALCGEDHSRAFVEEHFAAPGASDPVDKALRLDTTVMLVDDPVKRVDNMTMAWGLEARVPFLDHELVELAARIPPGLKLREGGKYALKQAARRVVPPEVIDRPKGYFPVPELKYLRGKTLDFVRDALASQAARERGLFRREYIDRLMAEPGEHITPLGGSKLWQIGTLELWLQSQGC